MARICCNNCMRYDIKTFRCGRCKTESYCSLACQRAKWPSHKLICDIDLPADVKNLKRITCNKTFEDYIFGLCYNNRDKFCCCTIRVIDFYYYEIDVCFFSKEDLAEEFTEITDFKCKVYVRYIRKNGTFITANMTFQEKGDQELEDPKLKYTIRKLYKKTFLF